MQSTTQAKIVDIQIPDSKVYALHQTAESVASVSYWRSLCPNLHVRDSDFLPFTRPQCNKFSIRWSESVIEVCRKALQTVGFFTLDLGDAEGALDVVRATAEGILTLKQNGWHPNFIQIYDEPWFLAQAIAEGMRLVTGACPGGAADGDACPSGDSTVAGGNDVNFDWLAYCVEPPDGSGMPPHRDFQRYSDSMFTADGDPKVCTVWISLGNSDPSNSCLYFFPATRDVLYRTETDDCPRRVISCPEAFQNIRAIPLLSGQAVAFSHRIYHWGSSSWEDAQEPRIAIAIGVSHGEFKRPYLSREYLPSPPFHLRLALAAGQMLIYNKRHEGPWPLTTDIHIDMRVLSILLDLYEADAKYFDPLYDETVRRSGIIPVIEKWRSEQRAAREQKAS